MFLSAIIFALGLAAATPQPEVKPGFDAPGPCPSKAYELLCAYVKAKDEYASALKSGGTKAAKDGVAKVRDVARMVKVANAAPLGITNGHYTYPGDVQDQIGRDSYDRKMEKLHKKLESANDGIDKVKFPTGPDLPGDETMEALYEAIRAAIEIHNEACENIRGVLPPAK